LKQRSVSSLFNLCLFGLIFVLVMVGVGWEYGWCAMRSWGLPL